MKKNYLYYLKIAQAKAESDYANLKSKIEEYLSPVKSLSDVKRGIQMRNQGFDLLKVHEEMSKIEFALSDINFEIMRVERVFT